MQVEFGGGFVTEEAEAGSEKLGMMIGFLVLAITLASLVAADLPLLTALIGVGISVGEHNRPHGCVRADRDGADAGDHARARRRHRLRAVHPRPSSPEHG